jgi:hypothetical protein
MSENIHLEEHIFVLLHCFRVNLLGELDYRLKLGIGLLLL